jgi:hypothetical protein
MASSKKIIKELDCVLSEEEKAVLAIKASQDRHKARELKEQASALDKASKAAEDQVANGIVKRKVECMEVKIFDTNAVEIHRCDDAKNWPNGNKVVEDRPMSGPDRQELIDLGDGAANDEKPKVTTKAPVKRSKKSAPN